MRKRAVRTLSKYVEKGSTDIVKICGKGSTDIVKICGKVQYGHCQNMRKGAVRTLSKYAERGSTDIVKCNNLHKMRKSETGFHLQMELLNKNSSLLEVF